MTRALRTRHRIAVAGLALLLPAAVAIALVARPAPPAAAALGIAGLAAGKRPPLTVTWQGRAGDATPAIVARIGWPEPQPAEGPLLELEMRSDVGQPETLAYWSGATTVGDALPGDAILLGPVGFATTRRFPVPAAARATVGTLVLYGIAQGRVTGTLAVPQAGPAPTGEAVP